MIEGIETGHPATSLAITLLSALTLSGCSGCGGEPSASAPIPMQAHVSAPLAPHLTLRDRNAPPAPTLRAAPAAPGAAKPRGPRYGQAEIGSTLEGAMIELAGAEEGPRLAQVAKRVLVWWVDLRRDLRRGDEVGLVYETRVGEEPLVHALWFSSQKLGGTRTALRFKAAGTRFHRWYETDGREVAESLVHPPIEDYEQITSLLRDGRGHRGVDFKAPVGTAILAPFDGVITRRNWSTRRNGNCLELVDRRRGLQAFFLHLDRIPKSIRPGLRVKTGEKIALSGNTGRSTAPHLHYQLERRGKVVDPFRVHETRQRRLSPEDQQAAQVAWARFEKMRARTDHVSP